MNKTALFIIFIGQAGYHSTFLHTLFLITRTQHVKSPTINY